MIIKKIRCIAKKKIVPIINLLPRNIQIKVKLYAELWFWKRKYKEEGENSFNDEIKIRQSIFKRYCNYFDININHFKNKIVVDIGCGPKGGLHFFKAKEKIGIDPLSDAYIKLFHTDKQDIKYVKAFSERIPLENNFVDAVIAVNSLDHVNDFKRTIEEIYRILKFKGEILFQIDLNKKPTICEPIILRKKDFEESFKNKFAYKIHKQLYIKENTVKRIVIKGHKI